MESSPLKVTVVSADREVWAGEADQVIARTSEGDIGILPNHSPLLAALAPSGVEVFETGGDRHVVAVDGGFISVDNGRVAILSEFARLARDLSLADAEKELAEATLALEQGDSDVETQQRYNRAEAQVKAGRKVEGSAHL